MKSFPTFLSRAVALLLCCAGLAVLVACRHTGGGRVLEVAYVSGAQVNLRDRVAAVYEKAGLVKNGERVEVLDRDRRFAKVRSASGQMGWMEQRFLVSQGTYDELEKLTADNAKDPVQAQGVTRNDTNLHVAPGRETEHLYQISSGEKLAILKRGVADKNAAPPKAPLAASSSPKAAEKPAEKTEDLPPPPPRADSALKPPAFAYEKTSPGALGQINEKPNEKSAGKLAGKRSATAGKPAGPASVLEDWWLVRDHLGRVGWVLGRMVDVDVPLDIAQYAEGQRIVAFFALNQVQDGDKKVPQYLTVLTEPKDGLPFDFNQFRVFTWNVKRHRYETAYRERGEGVLPVKISQENFDKEGVLPVFVIRAIDGNGNVSERKYKLNTPIVRRVLAPGEEPVHAAAKKTSGRSGRRKR